LVVEFTVVSLFIAKGEKMKGFRFLTVLVAAVMMITLIGSPSSRVLAGGSLVVTSVNEGSDATPGDGLCATATGSCTLRAAMEESNAYAGASAISFNLPGVGVHSISITSGPLPVITETLTIDGASQPNCNVPCIVISGASLPGPGNSGFVLASNDNVIQGFIITSWSFDGIDIQGDGNIIQQNAIGFWPGNPAALPNAYGIEIRGSNNLIGGSGVAARNFISGNTYNGIAISRSGGPSASNRIQGNYIGTNKSGAGAKPNGNSGIIIYPDSSFTLIGGSLPSLRNVISGNGWRGIDSAAPSIRIQGNYIGTTAAGNAPLPNSLGGLYFDGGRAVVGGGVGANSNVIAFNGGTGVIVFGSTTHVNIRRNSIYSNAGMGIDLGNNGVTANDSQDPDAGPNGYQNYQFISGAASATSTLTVRFQSKISQTYKLDFYSSPAGTCDPSAHGEGKRWLGFTTMTTNATGAWTGSVITAFPFSAGQVITGTAPDSLGNTSEFSTCRVAS